MANTSISKQRIDKSKTVKLVGGHETFIWTALPTGVTNGKLKLTAFLSPRLNSNAVYGSHISLDKFSRMAQWPASLSSAKFRVAFSNGQTLMEESGKIHRVSSADINAWQHLFPSDTLVIDHTFDETKWNIHNYSAAAVYDAIRNHRNVVGAANGLTRPITAEVMSPGSLIETLHNGQGGPDIEVVIPQNQQSMHTESLNKSKTTQKSSRLKRSQISTGSATANTAPHTVRNFKVSELAHLYKLAPDHEIHAVQAKIQTHFNDFANFHAPAVPSSGEQHVMSGSVPQSEHDFHEIITALLEYPNLLRVLGLAVDLEVDWTAAIPSTGWVAVWAEWEGDSSSSIAAMRSQLYQNFTAASRYNEVFNGQLVLSPSNYWISGFDLDGAVFRYLSYAQTLSKANGDELAVPPSLRTSGMTVIHNQRREYAERMLDTSRTLNKKVVEHISAVKALPAGAQANANPISTDAGSLLYAEDITRGYRIDVRELTANSSSAWYPLCARKETHKIDGIAQDYVYETEGVIAMAVSKKTGDTSKNLCLHDALFRWSGFSLGVPPSPTGDGSQGLPHLASKMSLIPGTLIPMRFGHVYQFRIRTADLAGNGAVGNIPVVADRPLVTPKEEGYYARFEPIGVPYLVPRTDTTKSPGESVDRMVVRSNYNAAPDAYNQSPAIKHYGYRTYCDRHVAPPSITRELSEWHGMLDVNGKPDASRIAMAIGRETQKLPAIADKDHIDMTALPDPLAQGVAFVNLPSLKNGQHAANPFKFQQITLLDFWPNGGGSAFNFAQPRASAVSSQWPNASPFRLRLYGLPVGQQSYSQIDASNRLINVYLAPAEKISLMLSCYFDPEISKNMDNMALFRWFEAYLNTLTPDQLKVVKPEQWRQLASLGMLWQFSSPRELKLVHAVQQPLVEPAITSATQHKNKRGDTKATIETSISLDGKSTEKVAVIGYWYEYRDAVDQPAPTYELAHTQVIEVPVNEFETVLSLKGNQAQTHKFSDTKHRQVRYRAVATSRFHEYFPEGVYQVSGSLASNKPIQGYKPFIPGVSTEQNYPIGDMEVQTPDSVVPTGPISFIRMGSSVELDIDSSARPNAPQIVQIIPSFRWVEDAHTSHRYSALRVYCDRPWFSSGPDELLAVVLNPHAFTSQDFAIDSSYDGIVTRWGLDPVWGIHPESPFPEKLRAPSPILADFKNLPGLKRKNNPVANIEVDGTGKTVGVVPYPVQYNAERRLWYADIELDTRGAYYPFIRFAFARYQPYSVDMATRLSRIVITDFAQIAPNRTASVTKSGSQLHVSVYGPAPYSSRYLGTRDDHAYDKPEIGPTLMQASIEIAADPRVPEITVPENDNTAWHQLSETTQSFTSAFNANGTVTWSGKIDLPPNVQSGQVKARIMIKEYERYSIIGENTPPGGGDPTQTGYRVVYAAAMPV